MFIINCHCRYTGKTTQLTTRAFLNEAKDVAKQLKKVYQHITVKNAYTGKIVMKRKDVGCCEVA